MNKILIMFTLVLLISNAYSQNNEYLIKISEDESDEKFCFINQSGDVIVPYGKYQYCYTDSIYSIGFVFDSNDGIISINTNGEKLFKVFMYDNGPDYISDGLFRIVENDLIGFANEKGEIIIKPQYMCAFPFEDGRAKVTFDCTIDKSDEHSIWQSDSWFNIDLTGKRVE